MYIGSICRPWVHTSKNWVPIFNGKLFRGKKLCFFIDSTTDRSQVTGHKAPVRWNLPASYFDIMTPPFPNIKKPTCRFAFHYKFQHLSLCGELPGQNFFKPFVPQKNLHGTSNDSLQFVWKLHTLFFSQYKPDYAIVFLVSSPQTIPSMAKIADNKPKGTC